MGKKPDKEDGQKWITGLVVPLMIAMLSAGVSWQIAMITVRQTISREALEGAAVFNNVGYRYFYAIYSMFDQASASEDGPVPLVDNDTSWKGYRAILSDITDDISWLRRNPAYYEVGLDIFPYMQNAMITEALGTDKKLNPTTLLLMCDAFVVSARWEDPDESTIRRDTQEFAARVCEDGSTNG